MVIRYYQATREDGKLIHPARLASTNDAMNGTTLCISFVSSFEPRKCRLRLLKLPQNSTPPPLRSQCDGATVLLYTVQEPLTKASFGGSVDFLATLDAEVERPE